MEREERAGVRVSERRKIARSQDSSLGVGEKRRGAWGEERSEMAR